MRSRSLSTLVGMLSLVTMATASRREGVTTLSFAAPAGDAPPTEFRIFKRGRNDSDQGPVMFDDEAARSVMAAYTEHGVRPIIDLEHLSLESSRDSRNYDPNARGDFGLEMRNGELWAVAAKWTEDGVERLRAKTQRYFSPAFIKQDLGDGSIPRVVRLVNVALVAQPALDHCAPLVAASSKPRRAPLPLSGQTDHTLSLAMFDAASDQENLPKIAEAFGLDSSASLADIVQAAAAFVKEMTDATTGDQPAATGGDNPVADDGVAADPAAMRMRVARGLITKLSKVATLASKAKPAEAALVAFRTTIMRVTNATTTEEATEVIGRWNQSHRDLANERQRMALAQAELDATDRQNLTVEIVKLGALTPAQAWEKNADGIPQGPDEKTKAAGKPSAFIKRFTITELRAFRDDSKKPGASKLPGTAEGAGEAPAVGATSVEVTLFNGSKKIVELNDREIARLKKSLGKKSGDDAAVGEALKKYATMKANSDLRAGTGKKAG